MTKRLSDYVAAHKGRIALGFLMAVVTVSVNLGNPIIIQVAIDRLLDGSLTQDVLFRYLALFTSIALAGGAFSFWMRRLPIAMSHDVEYRIRQDLFQHLTALDQDFYHRERIGDIMTRMASDLAHVREFIGQGTLQVSRASLTILIAFSVMFAKSWQVALAMLILMPTMTITFFFILRTLRERHERTQEQYSKITNYAQENYAGIRTIKGFAIEDRRLDRFQELNDEFIKRNLALSRIEKPLWPLMAFFFSLGVFLLLTVGGRLVIREELTVGTIILFVQYLLYMQWPVLSLGWTSTLLQRGMASWRRIQRILETEPGIRDHDHTQKGLADVSGDIEFRHVTVQRGGSTLLRDINLSIPEGSTVGITGPTGCGKSMLAALLVRMIDPSEGQVFIGVNELRDYPLHVLRGAMGMCPQEPFLFSETLRHNIAFGLEEEDETTMLWAADVSQLKADVERFPRQFDTIIGERGITLSGGQRQRAAISRAIARNPKILILDDVLAAVDTHTEAEILKRLSPVMRERTTIIISHRISALRHADFTVVLENGSITELGPHKDLVRGGGYYADLDHLQKLEAQLEAM